MKTLQDLIYALRKLKESEDQPYRIFLETADFSQIEACDLPKLFEHLPLDPGLLFDLRDVKNTALSAYVFRCFVKDDAWKDHIDILGNIVTLAFSHVQEKELPNALSMIFTLEFLTMTSLKRSSDRTLARKIEEVKTQSAVYLDTNKHFTDRNKSLAKDFIINASRYLKAIVYLIARAGDAPDLDFFKRLEDFINRQVEWNDDHHVFNKGVLTNEYFKICEDLSEMDKTLRSLLFQMMSRFMQMYLVNKGPSVLPCESFVMNVAVQKARPDRDERRLLVSCITFREQFMEDRGYTFTDILLQDCNWHFGVHYLAADACVNVRSTTLGGFQRQTWHSPVRWFRYATLLLKNDAIENKTPFIEMLQHTQSRIRGGLFATNEGPADPIPLRLIPVASSGESEKNIIAFSELLSELLNIGEAKAVMALIFGSSFLSKLLHSSRRADATDLVQLLIKMLSTGQIGSLALLKQLAQPFEGGPNLLLSIACQCPEAPLLELLGHIDVNLQGHFVELFTARASVGVDIYMAGISEHDIERPNYLQVTLLKGGDNAHALLTFLTRMITQEPVLSASAAAAAAAGEAGLPMTAQKIAKMLIDLNAAQVVYRSVGDTTLLPYIQLLSVLQENGISISKLITADVARKVFLSSNTALRSSLFELLTLAYPEKSSETCPEKLKDVVLMAILQTVVPHMQAPHIPHTTLMFIKLLYRVIASPASSKNTVVYFEPYISAISPESEQSQHPPAELDTECKLLTARMKMLKLHFYFEARSWHIDADFGGRLMDFFGQVLAWSGESQRQFAGLFRSNEYASYMTEIAEMTSHDRQELFKEYQMFLKYRLTSAAHLLTTQSHIYIFTMLIALNEFVQDPAAAPRTINVEQYGRLFATSASGKAEADPGLEEVDITATEELDPIRALSHTELSDRQCVEALLHAYGDLLMNTRDLPEVFPNVLAFFKHTKAGLPVVGDISEAILLSQDFFPGQITTDEAQVERTFQGLVAVKQWVLAEATVSDEDREHAPGGLYEL